MSSFALDRFCILIKPLPYTRAIDGVMNIPVAISMRYTLYSDYSNSETVVVWERNYLQWNGLEKVAPELFICSGSCYSFCEVEVNVDRL